MLRDGWPLTLVFWRSSRRRLFLCSLKLALKQRHTNKINVKIWKQDTLSRINTNKICSTNFFFRSKTYGGNTFLALFCYWKLKFLINKNKLIFLYWKLEFRSFKNYDAAITVHTSNSKARCSSVFCFYSFIHPASRKFTIIINKNNFSNKQKFEDCISKIRKSFGW